MAIVNGPLAACEDMGQFPFPRAVTIFATGTEGYGIRRCLIDMASGLEQRGIAVHFVLQTVEGHLVDQLALRAWPLTIASSRSVPSVTGRGVGKALRMTARALHQWQAAKILAAQISQSNSDAILLCSPLETIAASIAARRTGRPAYWMIPNEISDYPLDLNRRIYRAMFRSGYLVPLANSHFTDATLGPGNFRRRVCHLGIDPGEFDPATVPELSRKQIGIPDDAVVIGLFARMIETKGQLHMIRTIAALGDEARAVHLIMCGGPQTSDYVNLLEREAISLCIGDRIHNLGEQSSMPRFYQLCDIVANARLDPEPFGLSVIEAMMLGKPVLAHRAGGPSETIVDGETGWLIPSPRLEDFVAGLRRALSDRARWQTLGAAARHRALEHFTSAKMVDRVLAAMRELD